MIEVVLSTGDRAEAETPAGAVLAARTLMDDAATWVGAHGQGKITANFYVNGLLVRAGVKRGELKP